MKDDDDYADQLMVARYIGSDRWSIGWISKTSLRASLVQQIDRMLVVIISNNNSMFWPLSFISRGHRRRWWK